MDIYTILPLIGLGLSAAIAVCAIMAFNPQDQVDISDSRHPAQRLLDARSQNVAPDFGSYFSLVGKNVVDISESHDRVAELTRRLAGLQASEKDLAIARLLAVKNYRHLEWLELAFESKRMAPILHHTLRIYKNVVVDMWAPHRESELRRQVGTLSSLLLHVPDEERAMIINHMITVWSIGHPPQHGEIETQEDQLEASLADRWMDR